MIVRICEELVVAFFSLSSLPFLPCRVRLEPLIVVKFRSGAISGRAGVPSFHFFRQEGRPQLGAAERQEAARRPRGNVCSVERVLRKDQILSAPLLS